MTTAKPKQVVGYVWVSTERQAVEGVSLEAQEGRIRSWAASNGHSVLSIERDAGISGSNTSNRPTLTAAIATACKARGVLVVHSLSRLARSTKDAITIAERLDRSGADLVSMSEQLDTTSAAGRMMFRMLAVLGEFERDLGAERTTAALRHLRSAGCRVSGKIPHGYDLDGERLVRNEREQAVIGIICGLRFAGFH
jgi:DNA invertase Pin-like site-specific DNA recombinase